MDERATSVRVPLSRERVLETAVALADSEQLGSVTMRRLASELGVEAMSLYYHVANKEALLDGMMEVVFTEILDEVGAIPSPPPESDWKEALRARILTSRRVLLRHPWAPAVLEARTSLSPGAAFYFEGILAIMREGGFSYDLAHHALHALGSRALGFTQELFDPGEPGDEEASTDLMSEMAVQLPHLMGMLQEISHEADDSTLGWCDDQTEFEFGLDLLLDGLERILENP
jgi:AcrR family transcriptional regulator